MATDIRSMPSSGPLVHTNGTDTEHEIREYQKIIKLRDEIYAGKHPRFKPVSQPGSVLRSTAQPPPRPSTEKSYPAPPGASRGQQQNWPTTPQTTESQTSGTLLSKPDGSANVEIKQKRQRIEKELKRQVGEKRQAIVDEEDLNLEEVIEKAGIPVTRGTRPGQEDMDIQMAEPAPKRQGVLDQGEGPDIYSLGAFRKPPTGPAAMSTSRDQESSSKYIDTEMRSYNTRDAIPGRIYSPPARPHYSATSQLRSPAAPQPVRPANMARVESQDQRMIDGVDSDTPYGRYPGNAGRVPHRSRVTPVPYIKPEPPSPSYREPVPRVQTPDRGRLPSRFSHFDSSSRARHDYPPYAPAGYYPTPPMPTHRPYDPYTHREDPYAYPPAPVDFSRRSYTPAYVPPVASTYPPRPVNDDYDRRYLPPPQVPVRQPSRVGRRSASPPEPYRHPRHSSRSVSPVGRGRRASPRPPHAEYRPQSRMPPSPPRLDQYGRAMPPLPTISQRGSDVYSGEYGHPYAPPRERSVYGDERVLYYLPPAPTHYNEPRPESSITAREADVRSYRDREYSYSAAARQSLPPPVTGSGYPPPPPPPFDYARVPSRAASRAPIGPPPELVDYSRGGGVERGDYYDRALVRPDERERDYGGRASTRPDERGGYLPARNASVRPEVARGYGEREYVPEGRRDELREQYIEPPPMMSFGVRDPGQMQPPRLPYAGSEYGDSRYGGKY